MSNTYPKSAALFEQTERVIPGGADSPVRAFRGVCGTSYDALTELETQLAKAIIEIFPSIETLRRTSR
ncbi:MAG: hypothetical protein SF097_22490 [Acidobacteriota bacterium]|nr:hypothetical protein [Acidobacteriota bacterium]